MGEHYPPDPATSVFLRDSCGVRDGELVDFSPLTGGVASDIWRVQLRNRTFVIKRALSRLRVRQEWLAPVSRNASEVAWMRQVAMVAPRVVPRILAHDVSLGMFAMDYLDPTTHPVWKERLRLGEADETFAAKVGAALATIHGSTANSPSVAEAFANDEVFLSIRLEPYLLATAARHPDLREHLEALSASTLARKVALVHGDVSPKNILAGPDGPVFLDAECAWYGDPAFDLAFCLNHLLLKGVWRPSANARFLASFSALAEAYLSAVDWEPRAAAEARAARLLPALLLARIDGKSPVEYIASESDKARVRRVARDLIERGPRQLADIQSAWHRIAEKS